MFMSSIVWSYSKDLLHHACCTEIHLVVGKFQGKIIFFALLVNNENFGFFHYAVVTAQNMIY